MPTIGLGGAQRYVFKLLVRLNGYRIAISKKDVLIKQYNSNFDGKIENIRTNPVIYVYCEGLIDRS